MNNVFFYLQHRWMVIARILYFVLSLAIILVLVYDRSHTTQPAIVQPTVDFNAINQSVANLEQEVSNEMNNQLKEIKKLDTKIDEQKTNIKELEKRLQVQLEFNKRICEYIWVITIEKKLVPRKCTPDYNWTKETER